MIAPRVGCPAVQPHELTENNLNGPMWKCSHGTATEQGKPIEMAARIAVIFAMINVIATLGCSSVQDDPSVDVCSKKWLACNVPDRTRYEGKTPKRAHAGDFNWSCHHNGQRDGSGLHYDCKLDDD